MLVDFHQEYCIVLARSTSSQIKIPTPNTRDLVCSNIITDIGACMIVKKLIFVQILTSLNVLCFCWVNTKVLGKLHCPRGVTECSVQCVV